MKLGHPIITARENGTSGDCESELIRLNLNKPKSWKWELTTSKSSPNIVFPTIQLYDSEGALLAEATEAGCVINSNNVSQSSSYRSKCSNSTSSKSSVKSVTNVVDDNGNKCIVKTNFIPGPRKSRSCQDMKRNDVNKNMEDKKEKSDKYRRSFCVNSNKLSNIQEIASTDSDDNGNSVKRKPKYIYRTCSAGTLVICEDNAHRYNRRRPKGKKYVTEDDHKLNDEYRREERRLKKIISSGKTLGSLSEYNNDDLSRHSTQKSTSKGKRYRKSKTVDLSLPVDNVNSIDIHQRENKLIKDNSFKVRNNSHKIKRDTEIYHNDNQENTQTIAHDSFNSNKSRLFKRNVKKSASSGNFTRVEEFDPRTPWRKSKHDSYKARTPQIDDRKLVETSVNQLLCSFNGSCASEEPTSVALLRRFGDSRDDSSSSSMDRDSLEPKKVKRRQLRRRVVRKDTERPRPRDRLDIKLHPAPWRGSDGGYDQGYGSERSPEEEFPPSLPGEAPRRAPVPRNLGADPHQRYPFITPDCTFTVSVAKGPRGLGLSVSGGIDSRGLCPGLIRVKRLFPHQPAWGTGRLAPGDLLLAANGVTLTGLSNYEALEVLRMTPNTVILTVCRPPGQDFARLSPPTEPPPPPRRAPSNLPPLPPLQADGPYGEFDIVMRKQNGSLGFTLRKEDQSVLGHYVRALVREPALSDGRIRPGDRILAVNNVAMCSLSHEEAVAFLRQCGEEVKLRLYRDSAQTPLSAVSPTESEAGCPIRSRPHLRQEAMDMLYDLAARKLSPGDSLGSSMMSQRSPTSSARRLRRLTRTVTPEDSDVGGPNHKYYPSTASPSDSEGSVNSLLAPVSRNVTFTMNQDSYASEHSSYNGGYYPGELGAGDRPRRPNFLDLCQSSSAGTPVVSRKPCFQFTVAANSYELNNLNNDVLDAPTVYTIGSNGDGQFAGTTSSDEYGTDPDSVIMASTHGPTSMPQLADQTSTQSAFSHRQPVYQSAHPTCSADKSHQNQSEQSQNGQKQDGTKSLMKWKGVMFTPEEEASANVQPSRPSKVADESHDGQILIVELNRGWNSRLGFSLQTEKDSQKTFISAIYADSVAAKDGRLKEGDQLLMVNDESIESMTTSEVIDLLRIIRGSICIKILRKNCNK